MDATLLRYALPLIVTVTFGRRPPPSASTTSTGTSMPIAVLPDCSTSAVNLMRASMPRARVGPVAQAPAFEGFPAWGVSFYQELESNNTKEFWAEHKGEWERQVRDPMRALVAEL